MEPMNFGHYFDSVANRLQDKTALIYGDVRYTYRQVQSHVNYLAAGLRTRGIVRGDRVGLLCHNSSEYLEIVFACAKLGAVCVQYNWRLAPTELERLFAKSTPKLIFFSARFSGCYEVARPLSDAGIKWCAVGGFLPDAENYEALLDGRPLDEALLEGGGEDILLQLYTSGTTGEPKGVMLSHRAVICHALCNIHDCRWREDDVFPCVLPLFHASSSGTYNTLLSGGTVLIHERFNEQAYLDSIQAHRATRLSLTPTMLKSLLQNGQLGSYDLSAVRSIMYGAAPMPEKVLSCAMDVFHCDFYQLYGMTEMSPTVAVLLPQDHRTEGAGDTPRHLNSVGRPASGVLVRVMARDGICCPVQTAGEILVRGDGMMSGYQGLPEKSAEALRDHWYHTGDVGFFDQQGYLYITGRLTDVIISGEENICAGEVERCIAQLECDVQEVAVIGLPDERWGEIVAAAVVRYPGSHITEEEVVSHCRKMIASYKKPQRVLFVEQLPHNFCGKIVKEALRNLFDGVETPE